MAAPSLEVGTTVGLVAGKGKAWAETAQQLEQAKTMRSILSDSDGTGSFFGTRSHSESWSQPMRPESNPDLPTMTGKKEDPHPEQTDGSDKQWYDSIPENLQAERVQSAAKEILTLSKEHKNLIRDRGPPSRISRLVSRTKSYFMDKKLTNAIATVLQKRPAWLEVWVQDKAAYSGVVVRLDIKSDNPKELKKLKNAAELISKHHPDLLSTAWLTDAQKILQQAKLDYRQWREQLNSPDGKWGALSRLKKILMRPWRNFVDRQLEDSVDYVLKHQPNWLRSRMDEEVRAVDRNVEQKLNKAADFIHKHDASDRILSDSKRLDQLGKSMNVDKYNSENTPQQLATAETT